MTGSMKTTNRATSVCGVTRTAPAGMTSALQNAQRRWKPGKSRTLPRRPRAAREAATITVRAAMAKEKCGWPWKRQSFR